MRAVSSNDALGAVTAASSLQSRLVEASALLRAASWEQRVPSSLAAEGFLRVTEDLLALLRPAPGKRTASPRFYPAPQLAHLADGALRTALAHYDSRGACLDGISLRRLHIAQSRFITSMRGAVLADVLVEACDFTYGRLDKSSWERAVVRGSSLRQCSLVDASFDRTVFVRCDLRGADLGTTEGLQIPFDVRFVECDLHGATWQGRDAARMTQLGCARDVSRAGDSGARLAGPGEGFS